MAKNGSNNEKKDGTKSPFQQWLKRTFVAETSGRRPGIMPGIVWGGMAALVIIGVAIGNGWNPLSRNEQAPVESLFEAPSDVTFESPRESTPYVSEQPPLDGPVERASEGSTERSSGATDETPLIVADAERPPAPSEEAAANSVLRGVSDASTGGRPDTIDQIETPRPSAPTPSSTRPMRDPALPVVSLAQMSWPVTGDVVRPFGWYRYPALSEWRYSNAVVFQPAAGETEVRAALGGRVHDVVNESGLWRLRIEHAGGMYTEYEGLTDVSVASYQIVETAQIIGQVDEFSPSGVRFTVFQGEEPIDPTEYLGPDALLVTTR